jgi:hypothetical protein
LNFKQLDYCQMKHRFKTKMNSETLDLRNNSCFVHKTLGY